MSTKLNRIVLAAAFAAALLLLAAGPGTRAGLWEYGTGFLLMRIALFAGVASALVALVLLIIPGTRKGNVALLVAAIAVGLTTAAIPWRAVQTARSLPFIHDITTDTDNPPRFVDIVPLRVDAPNPPEYPGEEVAGLQREGYPDIDTLELDMSANAAFGRALTTAEQMGWEIVAAAPQDGRIEATATTFWFGFKDDIVIRIEESRSGSRLDIRSKSRVGRSDIGANAERIRRFVDAFRG